MQRLTERARIFAGLGPLVYLRYIAGGRFLYLLLGLIILYVLSFLLPTATITAKVLISISYLLILLAGLWAADSGNHVLFRLGAITAAPAFCFNLAADFVFVEWVQAWDLIFVALFLGIVCFAIFIYLLRSTRVTAEVLFAAVSVYLLLALLWAVFYALVDMAWPHAFATAQSLQKENVFLYFSIVTQSTLGYGDIVPVHRVARLLASVQAIVGQIYLTVLVAALVGMHISERLRGTPKS